MTSSSCAAATRARVTWELFYAMNNEFVANFRSGLPKFGKGAFVLLLASAAVSAILADQPVAASLVMPGDALESGLYWTPITANFIYPEGRLGGLIGTLFIQWFVGSALEAFWGTKRYLTLVLGAAVLGHVLVAVLGLFVPMVAAVPAIAGTTAFDMAAVAAFGVVFGKRKLEVFGVLPLTSRGLAIAIGVIALASPLLRGDPWPIVMPSLLAVVVAVLATTQPWRRGGGGPKKKPKKKVRKSHLRVVEPDPKPPRLLNREAHLGQTSV